MNFSVSTTHRMAVEHMKHDTREVEQSRRVRVVRPHQDGRSWGLVITGVLESLLVTLHGLWGSYDSPPGDVKQTEHSMDEILRQTN